MNLEKLKTEIERLQFYDEEQEARNRLDSIKQTVESIDSCIDDTDLYTNQDVDNWKEIKELLGLEVKI